MLYYRERAGLFQKELAGEVGSTVSDISRLENGSRIPSLDKLDKIATVLGVDLSYLFYFGEGRKRERSEVMDDINRRLYKLDLADLRSILRIVDEVAKVRRRRK